MGKIQIVRLSFNSLVLALLVTSFSMFSLADPANAERSYRAWNIVTPYLTTFSISSTVDGWDSSAYPNKIWMSRYSCNGLIHNYYRYHFHQAVFVSEGKIYEGNTIRRTFWNNDLSPYSIIYPPQHRPWWGGEMFPGIYMAKSATNKVWFRVTYSRQGGYVPIPYSREHIFYNNGWQHLI